MTAQVPEGLLFEGEQLSMCTNPLDDFFAMGGERPPFESMSSACWRGYVGKWEICGDRLYLIGLEGTLEGGKAASLATVFPKYPVRVFAHWFSGVLRLPRGRQIEYVHMGYGSTYEQDVLLEFDRGVLVGRRVRLNGIASQDAPEGYGVAASTELRLQDRGERS